MKVYFITSGVVLILFILTLCRNTESRRKSGKLSEFICRRCWNRLYKHCSYAMGLTKRSVSDEEMESYKAKSNIFDGVARERRSTSHKRKRSSRRLYYRVRINCRTCRSMCFT